MDDLVPHTSVYLHPNLSLEKIPRDSSKYRRPSTYFRGRNGWRSQGEGKQARHTLTSKKPNEFLKHLLRSHRENRNTAMYRWLG